LFSPATDITAALSPGAIIASAANFAPAPDLQQPFEPLDLYHEPPLESRQALSLLPLPAGDDVRGWIA
jgi:hypothetical protein